MRKSLFLIILLVFWTLGASAQSGQDFLLKTGLIDGKTGIVITGYAGSAKNIVIPQIIDGLPVLAIDESAFMMLGLSHVIIPEGVVAIGKHAFLGNNIARVEIPKSVRVIGDAAFGNSVDIARSGGGIVKESLGGSINQTFLGSPPQTFGRTTTKESIVTVPSNSKGSITVRQLPGTTWQRPVVQGYKDMYPGQTTIIERPMLNQSQSLTRQVIGEGYWVQPRLPQFQYQRQTQIQGGGGNTGAAISKPQTAQNGIRYTFVDSADAPRGRSVEVQEHSGPQYININGPQSGKDGGAIIREKSFIQDIKATQHRGQGSALTYAMPSEDEPKPNNGKFILEHNDDGTTASIAGFIGQGGFVSIPPEIEGYKITVIKKSAFHQRDIKKLYIPDTVKVIEDAAFAGNLINEVKIPPSVRYLGYQAFSGNGIVKVTIGSGVAVQLDSFRTYFANYYNSNGQKAGTYVLRGGVWAYINLESIDYVYEK